MRSSARFINDRCLLRLARSGASQRFDFGEAVDLNYGDGAEAMSFSDSLPQPSSGGRFYDRGDAIALSYPGEETSHRTIDVAAFSVPENGGAVAFAQESGYVGGGNRSWAEGLERGDLAYKVEAFDADDREDEDDIYRYDDRDREREEVEAAVSFARSRDRAATSLHPQNTTSGASTTVVPSEAEFEPLKSAQPLPETDIASGLTLDDQEFVKDLQAILSGAKAYDESQRKVVPTAPASPASATAASPAAKPEPNAHPSHDIFDRMGQQNQQAGAFSQAAALNDNPHSVFDRMSNSLSEATAFDLGTVALEQRFDEIERQLDQEAAYQEAMSTPTSPSSISSGLSQSSVPASENLGQLDAVDLVEDLAFIKQMSRSAAISDIPAATPASQSSPAPSASEADEEAEARAALLQAEAEKARTAAPPAEAETAEAASLQAEEAEARAALLQAEAETARTAAPPAEGLPSTPSPIEPSQTEVQAEGGSPLEETAE